MSDSNTPSEKDQTDRTDGNNEGVRDKISDAAGNAKTTVLKLGGAFKRGVSDARDDL